VSRSDPYQLEAQLATFLSEIRSRGYDGVTCHLSDGELFLDGFVPSYQAKREVEAHARLAGFLARNRLRIAPESCFSPSPGGVLEEVVRETTA